MTPSELPPGFSDEEALKLHPLNYHLDSSCNYASQIFVVTTK